MTTDVVHTCGRRRGERLVMWRVTKLDLELFQTS